MHTDLQLLSRYHQQGDALAFRDLMQAHAGMVYATARRVTRDEAMAEDVAQETFLQLARQSREITQSVAAWLHRVAWRHACNAVREDSTRRRYEQEAVSSETVAEREATWAEVETELDAVIDELPDDLRAPLVQHFLQGRSQREIAAAIGVSQSTVSRAVESGLAELRSRLRKRGLICGAGLAVMLTDHAILAAPVVLLNSLTKLGMSGIGAATVGSTATGTPILIKLGLAAIMLVGGLLIFGTQSSSYEEAAPMPVERAHPITQTAMPAIASWPSSMTAQVSPTQAPANAKPMPVHELVHSFPLPPKHPTGHLVQDAAGWIWGTTGNGGHYGVGTLYKVRPDGSDWTEIVSFNGRQGRPLGSGPSGGVAMAPDGVLWGATYSGGKHDRGTLYRFDPRSGDFSTEVEFETLTSPQARPTVAPDGQIWGTTMLGVYRYDPKTRQLAKLLQFTGKAGKYPGGMVMAELVPDGRGWLWGTASKGGAHDHGTIFKINLTTGEMTTVVQFTGKAGAFIGSQPICGLTLHEQGFFWGCTRNGGAMDKGTLFKIHAETGTFTSVAEFKPQNGFFPGANPETMLISDGAGHFWGTTSYEGRGQGTIYKVHAETGKVSVVLAFTGIEGAAPGGPARGHLLRNGPESFIGASGFGGAAWSGTIYRVNIKTGRYTLIKDMSDLARTTEGVEPHGSLCEGSDGTLWGTTFYHGAHHCGTIYKLDPVTQKLVSVIDFTGRKGQNRGRSPDAGLVSDKRGYLWGTTRFGGQADMGTIFKIHEETGVLTTIADFNVDPQKLPGGGPMAELVLDEKGNLWGTTFTTVFKVDPRTHEVKTITSFKGDLAEPYGSSHIGKLGVDGLGFVWGCSLAGRTQQRASLFKISIADDAYQTVTSFANANQGWSGWHPHAHMHRDSNGSLWFTGVLEKGGRARRCPLNQLNPLTGKIEASYQPPGYAPIDTPISDDHGRLWGTSVYGSDDGGLYTFDLASRKFTKAMDFTGHGAQAKAGSVPIFGRLMKNSDGNFYSVTRLGGPGNGGTIYRLRFGPTPMTQEATLLADGRVELHGTIRPNGRDTEVFFEWGLDPKLTGASSLSAGMVHASSAVEPVALTLGDLKPDTTYYFRVIGKNGDNANPQRGAVLRFTTPRAAGSDPLVAAAKPTERTDSKALTAVQKHALKVVLIPGAGAGIVSGALQGASYIVGRRYSLTAKADNDYIFAHWSGPGITGAMAESSQLDFIFTEELAKSPIITATFVKNPFQKDLIGHYRGLVLAAENITPSISNTGVLDLQLTLLGSFTGLLRYDGDDLPFMGSFDTGGSARFGSQRSFTWLLHRPEKPTLALAMQLDLSPDSERQVLGFVGTLRETEVHWQSEFHAERSLFTDHPTWVPVAVLAQSGRHKLVVSTETSESTGTGYLQILPAGIIHLAARLPDGTDLLSQAPLSRTHRLSFFEPLYPRRTGSFGMDLSFESLIQNTTDTRQAAWWFQPREPQQILHLRIPDVRDPLSGQQ